MAEKVYDVDVQHHYDGKNWLGSEVGVIKKTITVPQNYEVAEGDLKSKVVENGRTIIKSGAIFTTPYYGLLESDVDVTDGDALGDLIIAGRYINANLPKSAASVASNFIAQGLYAIAEGAVTRPFN